MNILIDKNQETAKEPVVPDSNRIISVYDFVLSSFWQLSIKKDQSYSCKN